MKQIIRSLLAALILGAATADEPESPAVDALWRAWFVGGLVSFDVGREKHYESSPIFTKSNCQRKAAGDTFSEYCEIARKSWCGGSRHQHQS